ncbi:MAG: S41 family peptidase [Eubacterium sp.]|nr:S41 family peptidase [Eubacterium sp.]
MKKGRNRFAVGFLVGVVSMIFVLACIFAGMFIAEKENREKTITGRTEKKLERLKSMIDYYYLDDVKEEDMEDGLYKGLLSGLHDPYSVYYTEEEYQELKEDIEGNYVGIGVLVGQDSATGAVSIVRCFENSPASEAGIQEGDIIYKVEGENVSGIDVDKVVAKIKGNSNKKVKITVYRKKTKEYIDVEVERRKISVPTVEYKMLDEEKKIGYIQILEFDTVTFNQFRNAENELKKKGMKSIVFDVRNNPGGDYDTVCTILDHILPTGTLVYTVDKKGNREEMTSDSNCMDIPVVVLQNGNSASASEIFAGAIQDFGAGKIVGEQSFGKGIVQQIIPLRDGSAIKLTIQKYFTPKGENIHKKGITPDVKVEDNPDTETDEQLEKAVQILNGEQDQTEDSTKQNSKTHESSKETTTSESLQNSQETTSSKNSSGSKKEIKAKKKKSKIKKK